MILKRLTSGPVDTNAYLLGCSETHHAAIIDVPFNSAESLLTMVQELGLSVQMLLLTHSHWDHIGEAALLKEKLNVPIYIHREDVQNLEEPGSDRLPQFLSFKGVKPDGFLEDGQILSIGNLKVHVIHTPGHTPGCVCFYLPREKVLLSGDTLFRGTIGSLSFATARPAKMRESLKKLAQLPPDTQVFPGHGEATDIQSEQWTLNLFE